MRPTNEKRDQKMSSQMRATNKKRDLQIRPTIETDR